MNYAINMVDAAGITAFSWKAGGQLFTENGPWASDTVTNSYTKRLRTGLGLLQPTGYWTNGFKYDLARRLTNVASVSGNYAYEYLASRPSTLVSRLTLPNTSYITNTFDVVARLTSTVLKNSSHTNLNSHGYSYNAGSQRTQQTFNSGSTYDYRYDNIGQLKVADSATASEDRGYGYDTAWNLNYRTNNTTLQTFSVNGKNELTNAPSPSSTMSYDDNGNLTSSHNEKRSYVYDDENRLVEFYFSAHVGALENATEFEYDGMGRLRIRREYQYVPSFLEGDWSLLSETRYLYDGWRVIQERDGNNAPTVSYTRGTDLSGSLEGAGGIGGLLARSHGYSAGTWSTHNFYHADGNGNITYLVDSSQSLAASYRYDPFGNTLSSGGSLTDANVYRFSSKEIHANSGLYYYGYRFYSPNLQRWLNRDPLGSALLTHDSTRLMEDVVGPFEYFNGGNLYHYVANAPLGKLDPQGLDIWILHDKCGPYGLHEIVVGSNPDGTYWQSDMSPGRGGLRIPFVDVPLNCPADIRFYRKTDIDPKNLGKCHELEEHVKTSPSVDAKVREEAKRRSENSDPGRWDLCGNNCSDYTDAIANFARGAQMREDKTGKRTPPSGRE